MTVSSLLGTWFCLFLLLGSASEAAPEAKAKLTAVDPKETADGVYLHFEGTSTYPDGALLVCELRYFDQLVPGATSSAKVRKGKFTSKVGPLPKKLLPGSYQTIVRFLLEYQAPDLIYEVQNETDAAWPADFKVGSEDEIAEIEKRYREAAAQVLEAMDAAARELTDGFAEGKAGKRWRGSEGFDADGCAAWTRECEGRYRTAMQALSPFVDAAVSYRGALTEKLLLSLDGLHLIASMYVKTLFTENKAPVPADFHVQMLDAPPELVQQQILESLQPVRDYLNPPKEKGGEDGDEGGDK